MREGLRPDPSAERLPASPGPAPVRPSAARPAPRAAIIAELQRTHGNRCVARHVRDLSPGAARHAVPARARTAAGGDSAVRVLARTPTADQTRWREIFDEQRAADPSAAHAGTLVRAFTDDRLSGSSVLERFLAILGLTGSTSHGPDVHFDEFAIRQIGTESSPAGVGDTGFRRELRDSIHFRRDEQGRDVALHRLSSDQIGHFLTAAHFGYVLTDRDNYISRKQAEAAEYRRQHPYLSFLRDAIDPTTDMQVQFAFEKEQYLRAMIGHELVADRAFMGSGVTSTLGAPLVATGEDVQNFLNDRLDLIAIDDARRGNSYQDMLLTWVGYRFGRHVADGVFASRAGAARWLELMLTESNLSAVAASDPFRGDAEQMGRMLQQFRDIQQRIHPAPSRQPAPAN